MADHYDMKFKNGSFILSNGKKFKALSGGNSKSGKFFEALPKGRYKVHTFQERTKSGMVRNSVGFSLHLTPQFPTIRKNLRIHPDGGEIGVTEGCIGISENLADAKKELKNLFTTDSTVKILIVE